MSNIIFIDISALGLGCCTDKSHRHEGTFFPSVAIDVSR